MLSKIFSCKWFTSKLFILLPSSFSITKVRLTHISQALVVFFLQTVKTSQGCCKLVRVAWQRGRIWGCSEDIAAFCDLHFTLLEIELQSFWSESNSVLVFFFFPHLQGAPPIPLPILLKLPTLGHPSTFQKCTHSCDWHLSLYSPAFQEEFVLNRVATAISNCRSAEHPAGDWKLHSNTEQLWKHTANLLQSKSSRAACLPAWGGCSERAGGAAFFFPSFPLIPRRKVCFNSRETKLLCCCLSVDKPLVRSARLETVPVLRQGI